MYNSVYPYNINFQKQNRYPKSEASQSQISQNQQNQNRQIQDQNNNQNPNTFPNGTKVAIDYTKGQINISQVLTDFRSTIIAINAPDDVKDEVSIYLNLVEKESLKENPSKEIILSNLKNASKISDDFIARSLNKPSNVVEGWIKALFMQNINLKSDPNFINPDFALSFPQKAQERINSHNSPAAQTAQNLQTAQNTQPLQNFQPLQNSPTLQNSQIPQTFNQNANQIPNAAIQNQTFAQPQGINAQTQWNQPLKISSAHEKEEKIEIVNEYELSQNRVQETPKQELKTTNLAFVDDESQTIAQIAPQGISQNNPQDISQNISFQKKSPFSPTNENDNRAKEIYSKVKNLPKTPKGNTQALNMLNEALGIIEKDEQSNKNIRAAIHIERGKIFDSYDYVDYALRDYFEATKAEELNLKAHAFYKTGQIYDEFNEFDPALDNYLSSVAYSGEADNLKAQSQVLSKIASLYTKQYDIEKTANYQDLALDLALNTDNEELIAKTYSQSAQNYQYLGDNDKALDGYKNALATFSRNDESYEQMAYNYEQAAITMLNLGNPAKAAKLQLKASLYYQKARLHSELSEEAG